jgi:hypothetical protein
MATNSNTNSNAQLSLDDISKLWNQLNDALEYAPTFQNKNRRGVNEKSIQRIESKLGVKLPEEIRNVVKVHDGRKHIGFGFTYRLATTDLLPIAEWRPYEKEGDDMPDLFFECLADENNRCPDKNLRDDAKKHLAAYRNGIENANQQSGKRKRKRYELKNDGKFQSLPCELLVIGEGADDYAEQYLLSIQSGRIYLAVQNIPEWSLIGTFADWINMGIKDAVKSKKDIQEQHDEI